MPTKPEHGPGDDDRGGESTGCWRVPFTIRPTEAPGSGVIVVSERLAPYEQAETLCAVRLDRARAGGDGAAGFVVRWVTTASAGTGRRDGRTGTEWSEHDLGQRFELGRPRTRSPPSAPRSISFSNGSRWRSAPNNASRPNSRTSCARH